ncbi:IS200/IS605 family transposase [Micromonospora globispora]|uniref:IS200/IS605 family transposase n=1 Tax=Micromonospora globispora TaxID=1450148 RepID=UPI0024341CB0|nr:IS200/IS605 family transposase [Micromonospora globispora]
MFTERHLTRLEETMRAVCVDFQTELVEFNGEAEHVHLLVNLPPKVALSKLVNSLKGVSWRRMRQVFPDFARHYYPTNKLASPPDAPRPCGGPVPRPDLTGGAQRRSPRCRRATAPTR